MRVKNFFRKSQWPVKPARKSFLLKKLTESDLSTVIQFMIWLLAGVFSWKPQVQYLSHTVDPPIQQSAKEPGNMFVITGLHCMDFYHNNFYYTTYYYWAEKYLTIIELSMIWKPNSIIASLFIQTISRSLKRTKLLYWVL